MPTTLEERVMKQANLLPPLLRMADRTGIFFGMRRRKSSTEMKVEQLFWPTEIPMEMWVAARSTYLRTCEERRKRPFVLMGYVEPDWRGKPLRDVILRASIEVADRIAMRALNAPLQIVTDGVSPSVWEGRSRKRPIVCTRTSDRLEYTAENKEGAQLMLQVLLSPEVQNMIHNKDHYSRARSAGET